MASPVTHIPSILYTRLPRRMHFDLGQRSEMEEAYLVAEAKQHLQTLTAAGKLHRVDTHLEKLLHPIHACMNATLTPIRVTPNPPSWEEYIPLATGLSHDQAGARLNPSMEDIMNFLNDEDDAAHNWGGDATNLSLVINDDCQNMWYPLNRPTKSKHMYVRVSYITAAELVMAYFFGEGNDDHAILSGTAGTGKSMFANVLMWRILQLAKREKQRALANATPRNDFQSHPILIFRGNDKQLAFAFIADEYYTLRGTLEDIISTFEFMQLVIASGQRAWIIIDTHPILVPYLTTYANQVYIASTAATRVNEYKSFTRGAGLSLITRIWSKQEVMELFALSYSDESKITRRKVEAIFDLSGGIPRTIFNNARHFNIDANGNLEYSPALLSALTLPTWEVIVQSIGQGDTPDFDHAKISSMIFHQVPRPIPRELYGEGVHQRSIIKWASPRMASEALQRLQIEGQRKSAMFLLTGPADYRSAALMGHIFEGLCYTILTRSTDPLKCRLRMLSHLNLLCDYSGFPTTLKDYLYVHNFADVERIPVLKPTNSASVFSKPLFTRTLRPRKQAIQYLFDEVMIRFPALSLKRFHDNSEFSQMSTSPNTLWIPYDKNYAGVDAIIPRSGVFIQITTAAAHSINLRNILSISEGSFSPHDGIRNSILILFVVPKNVFPEFTSVQTLCPPEDCPKDLDLRIHQAVIEVDISKEYNVL